MRLRENETRAIRTSERAAVIGARGAAAALLASPILDYRSRVNVDEAANMEQPRLDPPVATFGRLAFTRAEDVSPDVERPRLQRAATLPFDAARETSFEHHACRIHDLAAPNAEVPSLDTFGFDVANLGALTGLQRALMNARATREVSSDGADAIRRGLQMRVLTLRSGIRLLVLFVAPEGLIMRVVGPNGHVVDSDRAVTKTSGHAAATSVHADQDVLGTPLRQILRGAAPTLFRHRSADTQNTSSPLHLVNLWIPLQQITRPLALMDQRSLDRPRHQLRYALPTESFLDRPEGQTVNDIWTFLHAPSQRWYFTSTMGPTSAYVFDTLSTPHGAFIVPGEDLAEERYACLASARDAVERGERAAWAQATTTLRSPIPSNVGRPLREAIQTMDTLLDEARAGAGAAPFDSPTTWDARAQIALERVVRRSIELRMVCLRLPSARVHPPR